MNSNSNEDNNSSSNVENTAAQQAVQQVEDDHELDTVMPGFRFHPTEEELIEFYLRRKVEGKRFNVDLISYIDLYRYDPWELPAMAAIGEKEWYFYVPRDRKYRNGDRPNRVTTSGYWKATGADRMIRSETSRPIGLKKTLVFYTGKAPKGIRTSWIMNEYRLPHHETVKYQKAEISLCRVYKRAGLEDHPSVPRIASTKNKHNSMQPSLHQMWRDVEKASETTDASSSTEVGTALALSRQPNSTSNLTIVSPLSGNASQVEALPMADAPPHPLGGISGFVLNPSPLFVENDLHRLVSLQPQHLVIPEQPASALFAGLLHQQSSSSSSSSSLQLLNVMPGSSTLPVAGFLDKLWEWNWIPDQLPTTRDFDNPNFK